MGWSTAMWCRLRNKVSSDRIWSRWSLIGYMWSTLNVWHLSLRSPHKRKQWPNKTLSWHVLTFDICGLMYRGLGVNTYHTVTYDAGPIINIVFFITMVSCNETGYQHDIINHFLTWIIIAIKLLGFILKHTLKESAWLVITCLFS